MTKTPSITLLREAMLFSLTLHQWGNRHKADAEHLLNTTGDKKKFNLTKRLVTSPELNAITQHLDDVYKWCGDRSMQAVTIRKGLYFVKRDMIPEFERHLTAAVRKLRDELVPAFVSTYPTQRDAMNKAADAGGLGDAWNAKDYPKPEELASPSTFAIEWSWLALSVPEELPEEVRVREIAKLQKSFEEAQQEIRYALRAGFKKLIDHAVERLTPGEDGRPKRLYAEAMVTNFQEFFDTFNARDLMGDHELRELVERARDIIKGTDTDDLHEQASVRMDTALAFAKVGEVVDELVKAVPSRRFDLSI
jgi:hypothetical protein